MRSRRRTSTSLVQLMIDESKRWDRRPPKIIANQQSSKLEKHWSRWLSKHNRTDGHGKECQNKSLSHCPRKNNHRHCIAGNCLNNPRTVGFRKVSSDLWGSVICSFHKGVCTKCESVEVCENTNVWMCERVKRIKRDLPATYQIYPPSTYLSTCLREHPLGAIKKTCKL